MSALIKRLYEPSGSPSRLKISNTVNQRLADLAKNDNDQLSEPPINTDIYGGYSILGEAPEEAWDLGWY